MNQLSRGHKKNKRDMKLSIKQNFNLKTATFITRNKQFTNLTNTVNGTSAFTLHFADNVGFI